MKLTPAQKKKINDAWFSAGFGHKQTVIINKTTKATLDLDDSGDMNPATTMTIFKKGKPKQYYCYSPADCIAAIQRT